ncbi:MAG: hypothetical protein LAP87_03115 [Acidobacteriia bacterium]|nr:hypothetical protein [Terriglobia bacterium]
MKELFALLAGGCLFLTGAASPPIGFVRSNGAFRVDGSTIRGNGTLAEGAVVETTEARSVLEIGGVRIALLPASRARVYRGHSVLEKGSGVASGAAAYVIEAGIVRIAAAGNDSVVEVEIRATGVAVAARSGAASVRNAAGLLLASLRPGEALVFKPQAGAAQAVQLSGKLEQKSNFLTDSTTNITVELQGTNLAKYAGQTVAISGSTIPGATAAPGASQVVEVESIQVLSPGAAPRSGLSNRTLGVVVGGVAVGGTVAGLGVAGAFNGAPPPASAR